MIEQTIDVPRGQSVRVRFNSGGELVAEAILRTTEIAVGERTGKATELAFEAGPVIFDVNGPRVEGEAWAIAHYAEDGSQITLAEIFDQEAVVVHGRPEYIVVTSDGDVLKTDDRDEAVGWLDKYGPEVALHNLND